MDNNRSRMAYVAAKIAAALGYDAQSYKDVVLRSDPISPAPYIMPPIRVADKSHNRISQKKRRIRAKQALSNSGRTRGRIR